MSADNIIYVAKYNDRWYVWEQSASCDVVLDQTHAYLSRGEALIAAHDLEQDMMIVEYGVAEISLD